MKTFFNFLVLIAAVMLPGCGEAQLPKQKIVLFKDKVGISLYDPDSQTKKVIYKTSDQIFLKEPIALHKDTLVFAVRGELKTSSKNDGVEQYTKKYYSLCLSDGKSYVSKTIEYFVKDRNLTVQTTIYSNTGKIISSKDSSTAFRSGSYTYSNIEYNEGSQRFFSSSGTVNGKSAFSSRGNIYLVSNRDTSLLLKFPERFDPKFGSGYYEPQLTSNGKYLFYRYLPPMNLSILGQGQALFGYDLQKQNSSKLKAGVFSNLRLSNDDHFLLFSRNERQSISDTWVSDIIILDLRTSRELKIGEASFAYWID